MNPTFPRPVTILLVHDNASLRALLTRFLTRDGVVVITEETKLAALEVGRQYGDAIDVLITDVQLAHEDGIMFALQFRDLSPRTRVLLVTGFWNPRLEVVKQSGMRCLVKPFSQRRLLTVLKELLSAGTAEKNDDWAPDLG